MRKIYSILALALCFFVGVQVAQAEKRYRVEGGTIANGQEWTIDDVEAGIDFVLQSGLGNGQTKDFVNGIGKSSYITESNLFQLEATGTMNAEGFDVYLLKRTSTGDYVAAPGTSTEVTFTPTQARAWKFCVKEAVVCANDTELWHNTDKTSATTTQPFGSGLIFVDASCTAATDSAANVFLRTGALGKTISMGNTYTQNVWNVFPVEELYGADYLYDALEELFPNNTADLYAVGDQPGQISQALYDELTGSYADAQALAQNWSDGQDQSLAEAAVERCKNALQAAQDGAVPVKAGYYYFQSGRSEVNATYDEDNALCWTYNQTWVMPDAPTVNDTKYIWYLTENPAAKGTYFIQNLYTGRYIGTPANATGARVPTTETADVSWKIYPAETKTMGSGDDEHLVTTFVIENVDLIENPLPGWAGDNVECTALHCAGDWNGVVAWTTTADASHWIFTSIPQEQIDAIQDQIEQGKLNEQLEDLYNEASETYQAGFSYKSYLHSADQLYTNAQEQTEGPIENLLNSDLKQFWHSDWQGSAYVGQDQGIGHFLSVDLGEAFSELSLTFGKRVLNSGSFAPQNPNRFKLYGTNDFSGTTEGKYEKWVYLEEDTIIYDQPGVAAGTTYADAMGTVTLNLDAPYRYLRLDFNHNINGTSDIFYCFGYLNAGPVNPEIDEENSLIYAVPEAIRQNLLDKLEAAKAEIDAEAATQTTIDALQAAYDEFIANYPDPARASDAIEKAQGYIGENLTEGSEVGQYQSGALTAYQQTIAALESQIKNVMTVDEVNAVVNGVDNAIEELQSKLNKPAEGYYYLKSETSSTQTGTAAGAFAYTNGNGATVKWAVPDETLVDRPQNVWYLAANADGTYTLRNVVTGEYLNNPRKNNVQVGTSTEGDTCSFKLYGTTTVSGYFNIVFADDIYLNAQPSSNNMVTWNSAEALDNSAFSFEAAGEGEFSGVVTWPVTMGELQIITLPFDAYTSNCDGTAYSVIGRKTDGGQSTLELREITEMVPAGTPFFFMASDGYSEDYFDVDFADYNEFTWATEALEVNGLHGTLAAVNEIPRDYGVLLNGIIVDSEPGEGVARNSGYITPAVPETTETGDLSINIDGTISAIHGVTVNGEAALVNVYSLSGVQVRSNVKAEDATKGLPAGLYIVGQKKVLVK